MADKQPSLMDILEAQTIARSQDLTGVSSGAAKQALLNLAALPDQQNLWNNSTAYAQQAAAQQAAPGKAFGYDPQQAAFMETLFNPMNPETNGRMGTRPNAMAGLTQQALAAQSLADRKAKGAGTMAALSLDQLDQSNRVSNSPLAQIAASPELMKLYPYMQQLGLNNQMNILGAGVNTANAAMPGQQEAISQGFREAADQFGMGTKSLGNTIIPKGVYGGGEVKNSYGAPINASSTVATEMPNVVAAQNYGADLPKTIAGLNSLNTAWQGVKALPPGVTTNSAVTGAMSSFINGVMPDAKGLFGTKIEAGRLETIRNQLIAGGADPAVAQSAVYMDKNGILTMNNDAMRAAAASSSKNLYQSVTKQVAAGLLGDYQQDMMKGNQNANTATTASVVTGIQRQVQGTVGQFAVNHGINLDGSPTKSPDSALTDVVIRKGKNGLRTVMPISKIMQDSVVLSEGSLRDFKQAFHDSVKDGEFLTSAEAKAWKSTPEGQAALAQIRINNGMAPDSSAPPADATGQKKIQPNSWIDNMLNPK